VPPCDGHLACVHAQLVSDPVVAGLSDLIGRKKIMIIRPVSSLLCRLLQLYGMLNPAVFLFTELVANTIEGSSTPGGLLVRQRFASPTPLAPPACRAAAEHARTGSQSMQLDLNCTQV
jgi:hypothetical protein